ncbi:hypothetical protein BGX21_002117 [Mortierella sp. AD011]|nr:hypothetical protein BGX21_002117 [Mortierella sp. AD011]
MSTPGERYRRNLEHSTLLKCPPEILKCITGHLSALDLFRLTHTCRTFHHLTVPRDWFGIYCRRYPSWSKECCLDDELDYNNDDHENDENVSTSSTSPLPPPPSPSSSSSSSWKRITVKDANLCKRLAAPPPPMAIEANRLSLSSEQSLLSTAEQSSMDIDQEFQSTSTGDHTTATVGPTIVVGHSGVVTQPTPHQINTEDDSNLDSEQASRLKERRYLRILLGEALHFKPDVASASGNWRQMGSPVYHIDKRTNSIIAASMLVRPTVENENWLENRQILLYKLPDLTNPIAICASQLWADETDNGSDVSQLMDIRHYPDTIVDGEMRVVMIIVFGVNARPATQDPNDMEILDVWKLVKAVEIWIPVGSASTVSTTGLLTRRVSNPWIFRPAVVPPPSLLQPRKGKVEKIEPGRGEAELRGRIAKLYRAEIPSEGGQSSSQENVGEGKVEMEMADCIAVFGIQNSDTSSAIVIKKVLFLDDKARGNSSFSKKQISRTVSCMAIFPYYSNYERMLVLFNRHGRGLIWDWVNEKQIAQLHMPADKVLSKQAENAKEGKIDDVVSQQATMAAQEAAASSLYYWGAQVNWAVEVPYPTRINPKKRRLFRIVILADGNGSEWESSWWHVDNEMLGDSEKDLEAPPFIPVGTPRTPWKPSPGKPRVLYADAKRFEKETVGYCLEEQRETHKEEDGKPLQFIAYVIWNHFRIVLTSRLGLSIYDMEELGEAKGKASHSKDRQWVTFLEDTEENPLVDIATVGDNLVITRRFGQMIWPFYGLVS